MTASIQEVDFTDIEHYPPSAEEEAALEDRPRTAAGKLLTPKQIRARARRQVARGNVMSREEIEHLYHKPLDEWTMEELAHGRPANAQGKFTGPKPKWISIQMHEEAMQAYTQAVRTDMRATTVDALKMLNVLLNDDSVDERGKPLVPASTKVDISKFLIEHVVGKPTQRIENDVSVKLQAILGQVIMNPADSATGNYLPAHFPGMTMELSAGKDDSDDDLELGE